MTPAEPSTGPAARRPARPTAPATWWSAANITRRRLAVAVVAVALAAAAVGGARVATSVLSGPGGVPASAAGAGTAPRPPLVVRAEPGDSLWSIAERFRGDVPIRRYVDALIDRNGGTGIVAGQAVRLP